MSCDSLRGNPTFCTTASARSARVNVLPPIALCLPHHSQHPACADASRRYPSGSMEPQYNLLNKNRISHFGMRQADSDPRLYHRASTAPQVNPPPMASISTRLPSPGGAASNAWLSASGIDAADVLPCLSSVITILSGANAELLGDAVENALVGLMRHEQIDLVRRIAGHAPASLRSRRKSSAPHGGTPPGRSCADARPSWSSRGRHRHKADLHSGHRNGCAVAECRDPRASPCCGCASSTTAPAPSPNSTQVRAVGPIENAREGLGADHQRALELSGLAGSCRPSSAQRQNLSTPPARQRPRPWRCRARSGCARRSPGTCGPAWPWHR